MAYQAFLDDKNHIKFKNYDSIMDIFEKGTHGMEERLYWIWFMNLEKISTRQKNMLIEHVGSPEIIYSLNSELLEKTNILAKSDLDYLKQNKSLEKAHQNAEYLDKNNINLITRNDACFPELLKNIFLPPVGLFAKGDLSLMKRPISIGIVGSRNPTKLGEKYAKGFAQTLASLGVTIISGLAAGIDGQSHWGSIGELGGTIGVLGTGIDICYPRSNQKLFDRMVTEALIVSEFSLGEKPLPYHFPLRNRIISGLSQGVLVIEARRKSGSLITVNHALEQGKNVYVIPGDISGSTWAGGNQLLKEGAKLVTEPKDILEDFVTISQAKSVKNSDTIIRAIKLADPQEQLLYELINKGYTTIDELVVYSELPVSQVNSLLTMMEIAEIISIKYGNIVLI